MNASNPFFAASKTYYFIFCLTMKSVKIIDIFMKLSFENANVYYLFFYIICLNLMMLIFINLCHQLKKNANFVFNLVEMEMP